jgi:hypothetical protein
LPGEARPSTQHERKVGGSVDARQRLKIRSYGAVSTNVDVADRHGQRVDASQVHEVPRLFWIG